MGHKKTKNGHNGAATYEEWFYLTKGIDYVPTSNTQQTVPLKEGKVSDYIPSKKDKEPTINN